MFVERLTTVHVLQNAWQRCHCPYCPWTEPSTSHLLEQKMLFIWILLINQRMVFSILVNKSLYHRQCNESVWSIWRCILNCFIPNKSDQMGGYPTAPPRHSSLIMRSRFIWLLGAAASCLGAKNGTDIISLCYEFAWHPNTICGVTVREKGCILFMMEPRWGFNSLFYCLTNYDRLEVIIYIE